MSKINIYLLPVGDVESVGISGSKRKTKFSPSAVTITKGKKLLQNVGTKLVSWPELFVIHHDDICDCLIYRIKNLIPHNSHIYFKLHINLHF